ncbi:MAG: hypothetical protein ACLFST_12610 [Spirochaetia bacterium]
MTLEDSNGKISTPQNVNEVTAMIDCVGNGIDHCILSDGDMYIQTAGSSPNLVVEYQDSTGHYAAPETHSAQIVKDLFSAFFQKNDAWRTMVVFSPQGGNTSGPTQTAGQSTSRTGGKSFKDGLVDSVKREVKNNISGMVRRGVRNIFRKF